MDPAADLALNGILVAAAIALGIMRRFGLAAHLGLTGAAWAMAARRGAEVPTAALLLAASAALVLVVGVAPRGRGPAAAVAATVTAVALFLGRGAAALAPWEAALGRAARDASLAAAIACIFLLAPRRAPDGAAPADPVRAWACVGLLLYPGVVAGIYLHPDSHRVMLGLWLALLAIAILWLATRDVPAHYAWLVAWSALALPLIGLATVPLQGGFEAATEGPVRAIARTAGPLLAAYALARAGRGPGQPP